MCKRVGSFIVAVVLSLVVFFNYAFAEDLASIIKDVKAKYDRFQEEIKDMVIDQDMKMIISGGEMTSEVKVFSKGKKFRMETKMNMPGTSMPQGMETVTIYDGMDTWMISPFTGKQKIQGNEGSQYQIERNWWDFISERAEIIGSENISGRECYVIKTEEGKKAPFTKMWLDKKNLVLVKVEFKGAGAGNMSLVYSEFRKIKGDWEIPYKSLMYSGNELFSTTNIKSLDINKGLSEDLFSADKVEAKGTSMQDMMKQMMEQ